MRNSKRFFALFLCCLLAVFGGISWRPITAAASNVVFSAYATVLNAAVSVTQRTKINFVNGGCVDNAGTGSTDCTLATPTAGVTHSFTCNIGSATGSTTITTGDTGCYSDGGSYAGTINRVDIIGNAAALATCSITVDIWKTNAAIPTSGNKISASAPATLTTATVHQSGSLTGWTTSVAANDIWGATVATVTGCVYAQVRVEFQ